MLSSPPQVQLKWESQASQYLRQCLRLYESKEPDNEDQRRVKHLHRFFKVLQVLADKDPESRVVDEQRDDQH
ncbi:hypothetical protein ES703_13369 [subsurface metagenome]